LAREQIIVCKRIFPAQKISKYAKRVSAHGCVRSRLNKKLGFRAIEPRREPRQEVAATPRSVHGATNAMVPRALALNSAADLAVFETMAAAAVAATSERELLQEQRADAAMMASVQRVRGPP
jgi:hypothetical protein